MRLFAAINFDRNMNDALLSVQEKFRENNVKGNYTRAENLHLTLAFIGEYNDPDYVLDTLSAMHFSPFVITLDGIGSFDRLWWAGLSGTDELVRCAKQIRHLLSDAGIPFDRKKFSPHITLLRNASEPVIPDVTIPKATFKVNEISLMRSDRGKQGMKYSVLGIIKADI